MTSTPPTKFLAGDRKAKTDPRRLFA